MTSRKVTQMLLRWNQGDREALNELMPFVYDELHRLAHHFMQAESKSHTLQTTALAHETYLKLVDQKKVSWQNRAHFFAIAAQMMRRILIDHARTQHYAKRGGRSVRIALDENAIWSVNRSAEWLALDEALESLARIDEQKSKVVELKFFGGLTTEEVAVVLGISKRTVERDWAFARAWLHREITRGG